MSVIGVLSSDSGGSLLVEVLDSLVTSVVELTRRRVSLESKKKERKETNLSVNEFSRSVDELVGVPRVTVLESVSIRYSSISEENHNLMEGFRILTKVVPEGIVVLEIGLRVSLLSVDEVGELGGVSKEAAGEQ